MNKVQAAASAVLPDQAVSAAAAPMTEPGSGSDE
jgi:hypothetical protein